MNGTPESGTSEVEMSIEVLKRHKSPSVDQIPAELIKAGGRTILSEIYKLINYSGNKEDMELRRIFGSKKDEVTREWRKPHSEELNDLQCSPNIVRVIELRNMK